MSMRKDREITIIRESSKSSVRSRENLNPSLVEALFDENYDVSSLGSLNEERLKAPGYSKKDEKFVDQYSTVRDLAKGVDNKNAKEFEVNIPGVPKKITIVKNRFGVSRVYTGASQASEEEAWKFRSDTKEERFPVIEITPDTQPSEQPNSRDADVDTQNADDAATRQAAEDERLRQLDALPGESNDEKLKALLPEFDKIPEGDSLSYEEKLDKWLETYNKALDLSGPDNKEELKSQASEFIEKLKSDKDNVLNSLKDAGSYFHTNLKSITNFLSDDSMIPKSSIMTIVASERDRLESEGGAGRDGAGGESGGDRRTDPPGVDVVRDGETDAASGAEVETAPPPTPSGDAKALRDYIDNIAAKGLTPDEIQGLSENRRPLHKRSLIDLLYSS